MSSFRNTITQITDLATIQQSPIIPKYLREIILETNPSTTDILCKLYIQALNYLNGVKTILDIAAVIMVDNQEISLVIKFLGESISDYFQDVLLIIVNKGTVSKQNLSLNILMKFIKQIIGIISRVYAKTVVEYIKDLNVTIPKRFITSLDESVNDMEVEESEIPLQIEDILYNDALQTSEDGRILVDYNVIREERSKLNKKFEPENQDFEVNLSQYEEVDSNYDSDEELLNDDLENDEYSMSYKSSESSETSELSKASETSEDSESSETFDLSKVYEEKIEIIDKIDALDSLESSEKDAMSLMGVTYDEGGDLDYKEESHEENDEITMKGEDVETNDVITRMEEESLDNDEISATKQFLHFEQWGSSNTFNKSLFVNI